MTIQSVVPTDVLQAIVDEARRLEEELLYSHVGHNEQARDSEQLHLWLGIPTTIVAAAAGITSFSTVGDGTGSWASVLAGVLSFGVAATSGLTTFLDPK